MRRKREDTYVGNSQMKDEMFDNDDDVNDDVVFAEECEHSNRIDLFRSKGSKYVSKSNSGTTENSLSPYFSQETTQSRHLKKTPSSIFQRRRRRHSNINTNLQNTACENLSPRTNPNQSKNFFYLNNLATDISAPDGKKDKQNSNSDDHEDIFANIFHSLDQNDDNDNGDESRHGDDDAGDSISYSRKQHMSGKNEDSMSLNSPHHRHTTSDLAEKRNNIFAEAVSTSHNSSQLIHSSNQKFNQNERIHRRNDEHLLYSSYENEEIGNDHTQQKLQDGLSCSDSQHTRQTVFEKTPNSKAKISNTIRSSNGKRKSHDASLMITSFLHDSQETENILDTARKMEVVRQKKKFDNREKKKKRKQAEISPKSIQMKQVQSIAGSIPKHWKSKTARANFKTNTNALSQATKYSESILTSSLFHQKNKKINSISPTKNISKKLSENISNDRPQNITDIRNMIFRPSLLKSLPIELPNNDNKFIGVNSVKNHLSSEESDIFTQKLPHRFPSGSIEVNSQRNNRHISSTKDSNDDQNINHRDRGKKGREGNRRVEGPLSKRLKKIKSQLSGDWIRLRSGSYSFGSKDINDPRNRANMFIDVTILSDYKKVNHMNDAMVNILNNPLFLGYIHKETTRNGTGVLKNDIKSKDTQDHLHLTQTLDTSSLPSNSAHKNLPDHSEKTSSIYSSNIVERQYSLSFAWFYFNKNTLQEQKINAGSKLRLYDCVIIPSKIQKKSNLNTQERLIVENSSLPIVVCTTLCETYPTTLPPLTKVPIFQIVE